MVPVAGARPPSSPLHSSLGGPIGRATRAGRTGTGFGSSRGAVQGVVLVDEGCRGRLRRSRHVASADCLPAGSLQDDLTAADYYADSYGHFGEQVSSSRPRATATAHLHWSCGARPAPTRVPGTAVAPTAAPHARCCAVTPLPPAVFCVQASMRRC